jgi:MFS family permease
MCSSCGDATHSTIPAAPRRFAALRNPDCRPYLFGAALAMMADNIEHVITYWQLWQKFHSPALAGFQVISHWVPFLLFSVYFGSLADRFDCRRVIQAAQCLFMLVSAAWGVLFLTGTLRVWEACLLLVLHGLAGSLWGPGEQLMLHDFVGDDELPSAVRLNATFRSLGVLFGPVVGSALLLGLGPTRGIFANILFYLPLTLFLFRTRFTGHTRDGGGPGGRRRLSLIDSVRVLREVRGNHTLVSMIILGGLGRSSSAPRCSRPCRSSPRTSGRAARVRRTESCSSPTAPAASSAASCSRRPAGSRRASRPRCSARGCTG